MRAFLFCFPGAAGVIAAGSASSATADDLNSVVCTLNAVLNPGDAQRLEDTRDATDALTRSTIGTITGWAWRSSAVTRSVKGAPPYGAGERYSNSIGPEQGSPFGRTGAPKWTLGGPTLLA